MNTGDANTTVQNASAMGTDALREHNAGTAVYVTGESPQLHVYM